MVGVAYRSNRHLWWHAICYQAILLLYRKLLSAGLLVVLLQGHIDQFYPKVVVEYTTTVVDQ